MFDNNILAKFFSPTGDVPRKYRQATARDTERQHNLEKADPSVEQLKNEKIKKLEDKLTMLENNTYNSYELDKHAKAAFRLIFKKTNQQQA